MRLSKTENQQIEEAYEKMLAAQAEKEKTEQEAKKEQVSEAIPAVVASTLGRAAVGAAVGAVADKVLNNEDEEDEESPKEPVKEAAQPISFHDKSYIFFDRSMGANYAEWVDSPEDLKDALGAAKKVKAPEGVHIWEDTEGNIIFKVK